MQTKDLLAQMAKDPQLLNLRDHSPYLSSYISAVVLQDLRSGINDANESVSNALVRAMEMGVPELSEGRSSC